MEKNNDILSLRIVSIDNYMNAPINGLDPCYSEFRAAPIKQVPVIRIFGSDSRGNKTCMHVHGVFPYLYVPYGYDSSAINPVQKVNVNGYIYQFTASLDKAINISLGQTNSTTQHIFKIVLVKGIPMYGYHPKEHQYLKIYLYNPALIKRAAGLLQNGAILNKTHLPHESHIPYLSQFVIDYNLYPMSFLYVPMNFVCLRTIGINNKQLKSKDIHLNAYIMNEQLLQQQQQQQDDDDDANQDDDKLNFKLNIRPENLLKIERISTSKNELDIVSSNILNRYQNENKLLKPTHANPGIASIWNDEKSRRIALNQINKNIPLLLDSRVGQLDNDVDDDDRPLYRISEHELYSIDALTNKLNNSDNLSISADIFVNNTTVNDSLINNNQSSIAAAASSPSSSSWLMTGIQQNKTIKNINKSKLNFSNTIYPAECSVNNLKTKDIINASFIPNHHPHYHSNSSRSAIGDNEMNKTFPNSNETIVNEELILNLTQSTILDSSITNVEEELFEIFRKIEEREIGDIDDDSVLTPLTQTQPMFNKSVNNTNSYNSADVDNGDDGDDDIEDLNMSMSLNNTIPISDSIEDINSAFSLEPPDQMDGAFDPPFNENDDKENGNEKINKPYLKNGTNDTTPKSRYPPLDGVTRKFIKIHESINNISNITKNFAVQRKANSIDTDFSDASLLFEEQQAILLSIRENAASASSSSSSSTTTRTTATMAEKMQTTESQSLNDDEKMDALNIYNSVFLKPINNGNGDSFTSGHGHGDDLDKNNSSSGIGIRKRLNFTDINNENERITKRRSIDGQIENNNNNNGFSNNQNNNINDKENFVQNIIKQSPIVKVNQMTLMNIFNEVVDNKKNISNNNNNVITTITPPTTIITTTNTITTIATTTTASADGITSNCKATTSDADKTINIGLVNNLPSPEQTVVERRYPKRIRKSVIETSYVPEITKRQKKCDNNNNNNNNNKTGAVRNPNKTNKKNESITFFDYQDFDDFEDDTSNSLSYRYDMEKNFFPKSDSSTKRIRYKNVPKNYFTKVARKYYDFDYTLEDLRNTNQIFDGYTEYGSDGSDHENNTIKNNFNSKPNHNNNNNNNNTNVNDQELSLTDMLSSCITEEEEKAVKSSPSSMKVNEERTLRSIDKKSTNLQHEMQEKMMQNNGIKKSPIFEQIKKSLKSISIFERSRSQTNWNDVDDTQSIFITPTQLPPTKFDINTNIMQIYGLPKSPFKEPFYSNPNDFIGLPTAIAGNRVTDANPFTSAIINLNGLQQLRQKMMTAMGCPHLTNPNDIREFLATEKTTKIYPFKKPPNRFMAEEWLAKRQSNKNQQKTNDFSQAKSSQKSNDISYRFDDDDKRDGSNHNNNNNNLTINIDEDSPLKVRREKVKTIINISDDDYDVDDDYVENSLSNTSTSFKKSANKNDITNLVLSGDDHHNHHNTDDSISCGQPHQQQQQRQSMRNRTESKNHIDDDDQNENSLIEIIEIDSNDSIIDKGYQHNINNNNNMNVEEDTDNRHDDKNNKELVIKNVNDEKNNADETSVHNSFGISGVTFNNTFNFKMDLENFQTIKSNNIYNFLTIMTLELHIETVGNLKPNPERDQINSIFYYITNNIAPSDDRLPQSTLGVIMVGNINNNNNNNAECKSSASSEKIPSKLMNNNNNNSNLFIKEQKLNGLLKDYGESIEMHYVENELELIQTFLKIYHKCDPDILCGYEIEMSSWGYLIQRGYTKQINLSALLSRIPIFQQQQQKSNQNHQLINGNGDNGERGAGDGDDDGDYIIGMTESQIKLNGRILLDVWRLLRHEIALTSYTFENCMYHILHRRYQLYLHRELTKWWRTSKTIWIVMEYYLDRVKGTSELLNQLDLIGRTCELAKLFGIQFFEVFSRGSQFRVESMMLRIAKPKNMILFSPSVQQRVHMRAPEYLPLILEPQSKLYTDPMIILDFQSLYPSMMMAYNYCYSTCLGRIEHQGTIHPFEFGASQLRISPTMLTRLVRDNKVHVSPCGAIFIKQSVREGILPRLLREIISTRLMVKESMKLYKDNKLIQRALHSIQLGLKLMANVIYGYTAANWSGRMPCVEVADSVVSKGRETLERAIKSIMETTKNWNVKVVYGDTDSIFLLAKGRTVNEAILLGEEIAKAITQENPLPVKLKFERVLHPCILQTKKRYVGNKYESVDQKLPIFEAKGIETVRRDGCPAVSKILEKVLKILFETCDISAVKKYTLRQFTKILKGQVNIMDLIYAKEYRGMNGYKPTACVPALELARKWKTIDPRNEPRRGERVPYVIVNGPPNVPLIRLVRSPYELLEDDGLKINAEYYITKAIIPPLNRCLYLIGVDAKKWYDELPRTHQNLTKLSTANTMMRLQNTVQIKQQQQEQQPPQQSTIKKSTITQYFSTTNCAIDCGEQTQTGICKNCLTPVNIQKSAIILSNKIAHLDRQYGLTHKICENCCGRQTNIKCKSLDCPVLFVLNQKSREYQQLNYFRELFKECF